MEHHEVTINIEVTSYEDASAKIDQARKVFATGPARKGLLVMMTHWTDKNGKATHTLVMSGVLKRPQTALIELYLLAESIGEEAIAVYDHHMGVGFLEGPQAARWEPFDRSQFQFQPQGLR